MREFEIKKNLNKSCESDNPSKICHTVNSPKSIQIVVDFHLQQKKNKHTLFTNIARDKINYIQFDLPVIVAFDQ